MTSFRHIEHEPTDLTGDLAKSLPRWVGWVPVVGKATHRWWVARRAQRQPTNNVEVQVVSGSIHAHARDEANMELRFVVVNYGKHLIEVDRLEVHSLAAGSRSLQRKADMINMSGAVRPRSTSVLSVTIDLRGSDIRNVVQGVRQATNTLSSPQGGIGIYADIVFLARKERFKKTVQLTVDSVLWNIGTALGETLAKADGVTVV